MAQGHHQVPEAEPQSTRNHSLSKHCWVGLQGSQDTSPTMSHGDRQMGRALTARLCRAQREPGTSFREVREMGAGTQQVWRALLTTIRTGVLGHKGACEVLPPQQRQPWEHSAAHLGAPPPADEKLEVGLWAGLSQRPAPSSPPKHTSPELAFNIWPPQQPEQSRAGPGGSHTAPQPTTMP